MSSLNSHNLDHTIMQYYEQLCAAQSQVIFGSNLESWTHPFLKQESSVLSGIKLK